MDNMHECDSRSRLPTLVLTRSGSRVCIVDDWMHSQLAFPSSPGVCSIVDVLGVE